MTAVSLTPGDLANFADIEPGRAQDMIDDALALAELVAPCITANDFAYPAAAKAILRAAVLRWNEAGTGALSSESVDDYSGSVDTRQQRRGMFWPSEITQLQDLCRTSGPAGAFAIDTVAAATSMHADICSLNFGALYCSCGAVLTQGLPLYENL